MKETVSYVLVTPYTVRKVELAAIICAPTSSRSDCASKR